MNRRGQTCSQEAWRQWGMYSGAIIRSYHFDLAGSSSTETSGGMSYFRNRWYDPRTGRFTAEDPIGFTGTVNLYAYGDNNPVSYTDPFGLCPKDKGGDGRTNSLSDCPPGSEGWREFGQQATERLRPTVQPSTWISSRAICAR